MPENSSPRKISAPARIGNAYELRLFALACLWMVADHSIEHVRHEDSSAAPADDVIIEFADRLECYQAKHSMNPHALVDIDFDSGELIDSQAPKFHISLAKLAKAWQSLQCLNKTIIIRIFTNRAAGAELGKFLNGDRFKEEFVAGTWQQRKRKKLRGKMQETIELSDDELISFLASLRYDLRQPKEEELDAVIQTDWLQRKFGLTSPEVHSRFLSYVERWYLERKTRPVRRDEVLKALQIDNSTLPQRFPVDARTYISRPDFKQEVLKQVFQEGTTYTAVVGPPGSGKSTFITKLIEYLQRKRRPLVRYYAFTQVGDPSQRERVGAQAFLKSMIEQLYCGFHDLLPDEERYDYSESRFRSLLKLLGNHFRLRGQKILMIVDGIDHVGREAVGQTQKLLNALPQQLPDGVACLIGTQSIEYLPPVIERQCRESLKDIPLFDHKETQHFLNRYFDKLSRPKIQTTGTIYRRSEGLPLYLHFISERLIQVSVEQYDDVVKGLPSHSGNIDSYYSVLWSEFVKEPKLKRLCGVVARLSFRIQTSALLEIANVTDAFEGEELLSNVKHLLDVSDVGCRIFHNSFRDFVHTELSADQLQQLDNSILVSYLDKQRGQLLWFMYAHLYAESAKDYSYLVENYKQNYVSEAICRGRPSSEICAALQATARAAISKRDLVATAYTAALLSHTQERLDYYINRAQLWRTLLAIGEMDDALAAFAQEREVYDLSSETAEIIVHLAERGEYELGNSLAQNFIQKLPEHIEGGSYAVEVGTLVSIYSPYAAATIANWAGAEPTPSSALSYGQIDLGTQLLPRALSNIYDFQRWNILRALRRLLEMQPGWSARKDSWFLETARLETIVRPETAMYHIRTAARCIENQAERILLSGHIAQHNLDSSIVEELLDGVILQPQFSKKRGFSSYTQEFKVFRAYVFSLAYLKRYRELEILYKLILSRNSSVSAYYRLCYEVSASDSQSDRILSAIAHFAEYERIPGERIFEIQQEIMTDLRFSFLEELVDRYIASQGKVDALLDCFRHAFSGKTFSIPKITCLEVLSKYPSIRPHLQHFLVKIHDDVIATQLETQSRTEELLTVAELAGHCGYFSLGRTWLQEAVFALRGYGHRKDSTVSLLIESLEEINELQPELLRQRVAAIADWNLLIQEFTDGKGTRWFPVYLYDVALRFDKDIARGLLSTYCDGLPEWKFSYALARFLRSYTGDKLELAYALSEVIHSEGFYSEDDYKHKFDARFNLLKEAVAQGEDLATEWMRINIKRFVLSEAPPDKRLPFIEAFNTYALEADIAQIQEYSVYPSINNSSSTVNSDLPEYIEWNDEEISINDLPQRLSVSIGDFSQGIDRLMETYRVYQFDGLLQQAIEQLVDKSKTLSELDQIATVCVETDAKVAEEGYRILAKGYLNLGHLDKATEYYRESFICKNKFNRYTPDMRDFEQLAEINPQRAFDTLFEFVDDHLSEFSWGGETTFLLFIRGALSIGKDHCQSAINLYETFEKFTRSQFECLPMESPSPYAWMREAGYEIKSFEEVSHQLIEKTWSEPLIYLRQHIVHLLKELAIYQPVSTVPWLIGLLQHNDYTLNTQSALVLSAVALANPDLLAESVDTLLDALDAPHAERNYYIRQALEAIAKPLEDRTRIDTKLQSLRTCLINSSRIILPHTLRPSNKFSDGTLQRTAKSICKTIEKVGEEIGIDIHKLYWQIEQEMESMGYSREIAQQEYKKRGQAYSSSIDNSYIMFETYDGYYVWHAFNQVVERELRDRAIGPDIQIAVDSLVRLYDPQFPLNDISSKPTDINVPFVSSSYSEGNPMDAIQPWLSFEQEDVLRESQLEDDWLTVVDEYYQRAGRIAEQRLATASLVSNTFANAVLEGEWNVESGDALLQMAPKPPYYSLTIDEAHSHLERSRSRSGNGVFGPIPLVSVHWVAWWHFERTMLASIAGEWIHQYGLTWNSPGSMDLLFGGNLAQKFLSWRDGFEASYSRRRPIGYGNRLLLSKNFLSTLLQEHDLCLMVATWSKRSVYDVSVGKKDEIESMEEQEVLSIYRG